MANRLRYNPFDMQLLQDYRSSRKRYKQTLKSKRKTFLSNTIHSLENLQQRNPKQFWDIYNDLKELDKPRPPNPIPAEEWIAHFNKLLNKAQSVDPSFESMIENYIDTNKHNVFNDLNFRITKAEIIQASHKLSTGKSSGIDGILNEMLKCGITVLLPSLHKLFNIILTSGLFPTTWGTNTLSPLHKKGDRNTSDNYRGIAVGSNLSKLFCSVIHNRL